MQPLDDLRTDDEWSEDRITIGEPVTLIVLERPKRKPEPAHHNPIHLSPRQTMAMLRLLKRNEVPLRGMSEEEEKERSRALERAYCLVLRYRERSKGESPTPEDWPARWTGILCCNPWCLGTVLERMRIFSQDLCSSMD